MRDAELIRVAAYAGLRQGDCSRCAGPTSISLAASSSCRVLRPPMWSRPRPRAVASVSSSAGPSRRRNGPSEPAHRRHRSGRVRFLQWLQSSARPISAEASLRPRPACRRLPPLRFHDLRHTYGSLLVAGGVDLISVKSAMGHSQVGTTERDLHARPATELGDRFTTALGGIVANSDDVGRRSA